MKLLCSKRVEAEELIDRPETSLEDIRQTLRDQELVNRVLGGAHATYAHAIPLIKQCGSDPVRVLDMACGGADLSRGIVEQARRMGRRIEIVAADLNEKTIALARELSVNYPEISFVRADALRTPFVDGAFDVVILATFLHHLQPEMVIRALREMQRVSKGHVVAADLVRSSLARIAILAFAGLTGFNKISSHDGAVSVCRAYKPAELGELARHAALRDWRIYQHSLYRMTLVYRGAERNGKD